MKLPKIQEEDWKSIGVIANYYGGLEVAESSGRYFWNIEPGCLEEIPKTLYDELLKFEANRKKEQK